MKNKYIVFPILTLSFLSVVYSQTPTQSENYIKVSEALVPTTASLDNLSANEKKVSVMYFDGLGRDKQAIQYNATPDGKSIIVHYEYDEFGRPTKEFLPAPVQSNTVAIHTGAKATTASYYSSHYNQNIYFSEKQLEASPLSRLQKQAAPGNAWALGSGNEIKFYYDTNTSAEVRLFKANASWSSSQQLYTISLTEDPIGYNAGQLYKTTTADENSDANGNGGGRIEEFKDKEGRVVLKRTYNGTSNFDTYYVYDKYGNLTYVIPPKLADEANVTLKINKLGYQYKYDSRNRLVEKKLPGKAWEYMIYDKQDRLIATQDGNLKAQGKWLYTKYDKYGRVVYTGVFSNGGSRTSLQTQADTYGSNNEYRTSSSLSGSKCNYTNNAFPPIQNPGQEIYTVNYYDYYDNIPSMPSIASNISIGDGHYIQPKTGANNNLNGMHVASIISKFDANQQVNRRDITYTLYDDKNRAVRTFSRQHTGGYQFVDSQYDFRGKPLYQRTIQRRISSENNLSTKEYFTYDPQERLLTHQHKVQGGNLETLAHNQYDDLGQLTTKKVGGTTTQALQSVDYQYNIRGWLTDINNVASLNDSGSFGGKDLFTFQLNYEEPVIHSIAVQTHTVTQLYNGNISALRWRTKKDNILRGYDFAYDDLNRLSNGVFVMPQATNPIRNSFNEKLEYDKNGNITQLYRTGQDNPITIDSNSNSAYGMDQLTYTYDEGNQLQKVTDGSNNSAGFDNGTSGSATDYTYDANGNMISDLNKEISLIEYNHLNLPTRITWANNNKIEYLYDATGVKFQKKVTEGTQIATTDYQTGFQYLNGELQFFPTAEGYVKYTYVAPNDYSLPQPSYDYVYNYTDHLGNIRLSYTKDPNTGNLKILEENNYYPFGLKHGAYNSLVKKISADATKTSGKTILTKPYFPSIIEVDYNYKYNGQELQTELGLNWYTYRYRNYDATIGRFFGVDPISEKYYNISTYQFAHNNPVWKIEIEGLEGEESNSGEDVNEEAGNNASTSEVFVKEVTDLIVPIDAASRVFTGNDMYGNPAPIELSEVVVEAAATVIKPIKIGKKGWKFWKKVKKFFGIGKSKANSTSGKYSPKEPLRKTKTGEPKVDAEAEGRRHTQLGKKEGRNGDYTQGREFDKNGKPVRDIDHTDHGRPKDHTNPHQHDWEPNSTGGTPKRGKAKPIED